MQAVSRCEFECDVCLRKSLEDTVMFQKAAFSRWAEMFDRLAAFSSPKLSLGQAKQQAGASGGAAGMDLDASGKGKGKGSCFSCGQLGHLARDCSQGKGGGTQMACYLCGKPGHLARDYPYKGQKSYGGKSGGEGKDGKGEGHGEKFGGKGKGKDGKGKCGKLGGGKGGKGGKIGKRGLHPLDEA